MDAEAEFWAAVDRCLATYQRSQVRVWYSHKYRAPVVLEFEALPGSEPGPGGAVVNACCREQQHLVLRVLERMYGRDFGGASLHEALVAFEKQFWERTGRPLTAPPVEKEKRDA